MTNQIQPSHISEEQPERFNCWKCGQLIWKIDGWLASRSGRISHCNHEADHRLPENAQKRREVEEYLQEKRS